VEAPGIENADHPENAGEADRSSEVDAPDLAAPDGPNPATAGAVNDSANDSDSVERALARAVELAAAAGEWDAVATLARELSARRLAREAPG